MKLISFLTFLLLAWIDVANGEQPLAEATVVVYNKAAPDSPELAKFYAQQRGIPTDHVIGLTCSNDEEISRADYDTTIADPLREIFQSRHWWRTRQTTEQKTVVEATSIRFVALIKGIPLKIKAEGAPYPGDTPGPGPVNSRNEASVDSELTTLGLFSRQISGPFNNPYYESFKTVAELNNPALLLVCRLDAPTAAIVRRMIVDSIAAEKTGLWGRAFVDGAHNTQPGMKLGDDWLSEIPQQLHRVGVPVIYDDSPDIFPDGYPMTDCALYYGWYAGAISGPFNQPDFRFVPGAVAVHIHSFSAGTLRNPNENWVGPLLARGAAASVGNVYEPYLQMTAHLDVLNDHLLHGFTFAESAYSSVQVLSWMSVMVGDPLYRPYASWLQIDNPDRGKISSWKAYHDFAVHNFTNSSAQYRTLARQTATTGRNCPMLEDVGLMEVSGGNLAVATSCFGQARLCFTNRDDILRVVLEEADAWNKQKKPKRALDLLRSTLRIAGNAPAAPLLQKMDQQIRGAAAMPNPTARPTPRVRVRF